MKQIKKITGWVAKDVRGVHFFSIKPFLKEVRRNFSGITFNVWESESSKCIYFKVREKCASVELDGLKKATLIVNIEE